MSDVKSSNVDLMISESDSSLSVGPSEFDSRGPESISTSDITVTVLNSFLSVSFEVY